MRSSLAQSSVGMCEIQSCDGNWTDSCEGTGDFVVNEPKVLATFSDQDLAGVVNYAGALRSSESRSEEAEHNQWKPKAQSLRQPRSWDLCFRIVLRKGQWRSWPCLATLHWTFSPCARVHRGRPIFFVQRLPRRCWCSAANVLGILGARDVLSFLQGARRAWMDQSVYPHAPICTAVWDESGV